MSLDHFGQLQVASNDGHLVRGLAGVVERRLVGAAKKQRSGAGLLVINGANVKWRVSAGVSGVHVGRVKEQPLQVLNKTVSAGLKLKI